MDFDSVARELLALPVDEFTASRNSKVKELKAAGDDALAVQVGALRRPSLPLWAVNQLANDGVLNLVRDAADAAAKAQLGTSSAELRTTAQEFERVLHEAGQRAADALQAGGHAASDDAVRRARELIRTAALQGGETWERLASGALTAEPELADSLAMLAAAERAAPEGPPPAAARDLRLARRKAQDDARLAERALERAQRMRAEATAMAERAAEADSRAREAEEQAERAREQAEESARAAGE